MTDNAEKQEPSGAEKMFGEFAPALVAFTDDVVFGQAWKRQELSPKERSLVTVASLTTGGNTDQLAYHLGLAKDNGASEQELIEAITHLAFYAGWPKAMSAMAVAKQVFRGQLIAESGAGQRPCPSDHTHPRQPAERKNVKRGAVLHAPGDVGLEPHDDPKIIEPSDAIIRIAATCVCGSDLWDYRGINPVTQPKPMGHEYCGIVEEVGSDATSVKPGQFVIGSFYASDNTCPNCRAGFQTSCLHRVYIGDCQAEYVPSRSRTAPPSPRPSCRTTSWLRAC